jgi:CubicO group peptidase (beta-lactamase class C family)
MRKPWKLGFCLAALLAVVDLPAEEPPPAEFSALLDEIEKIRKREGIAAVGVTLVDEDRTLWSGGLGTISHQSAVRFESHTLIRIGSITKTFTSLAVLLAEEAGALSLDDPISNWVPPELYKNPWEATDPIRVAHLLEHTAGFRGLSRTEFDYTDAVSISLLEALSLTPETHETAWRPGFHSSYTNLGAGFAGLVLEQATGKSYESLIEEGIFTPLGMKRSGLRGDQQTLSELAIGYDSDGRTVLPYWHMVFPPFGAINTTSREMGEFVRMLINNGAADEIELVSADVVARMEAPHTTLGSRHGLDYGYGLGNYQWYNEGIMFHGHGGDADGYLSHFGYTRANNQGYFVVINAFKKSVLAEIQDLIEKRLIRDLPPPEYATAADIPVEVLSRYVGDYENATSRFNRPMGEEDRAGRRRSNSMTISLEDGKLYTRINDGMKFELIPLSENLFRRTYRPRATSVLIIQDDGSVIYQDSQYNFLMAPPRVGRIR